MQIQLVGAELFHADGRTYNDTKSYFTILQTHLKKYWHIWQQNSTISMIHNHSNS
jgi:hypothetical protein